MAYRSRGTAEAASKNQGQGRTGKRGRARGKGEGVDGWMGRWIPTHTQEWTGRALAASTGTSCKDRYLPTLSLPLSFSFSLGHVFRRSFAFTFSKVLNKSCLDPNTLAGTHT
ncbi:hypothetical protein LZ32DRAFT_608334 [Colletotrichum eremochloae]|nr:hypothetical protein LZ32DRAFT_608334 [Colletotrichum eremochloae]